MKKNLLLLLSFCLGIFHTYSQSINYLNTVNGAIIPTDLPSSNYIGPNPYTEQYGSCDNGGWQWIHALCSGSVINSPDSSLKPSFNGTSWIPATFPSYMVVDMGVTRTFNELRVFQMFSDGKVTHASMYVHPATTGVAPAYSDAAWVSVLPESLVTEGTCFANDILNSVVTSPSVFSFTPVTARYVKFEFRNDGRYGNSGYIEVRELKLFNNPLTGVNDNYKKDQLAIYPNPTDGFVNISFPESDKQYDIEIYSVIGELVKRFNNQVGNKISLDLTGNTKGLYFVKILQGNKIITMDKLFLQK